MGTNPGSDTPVTDYLESTGAVELLCEIEPNGSQFTHLAQNAPISRATVSTRLQEGEELGVFEQYEIDGRGTSHAYRLTETGATIRLYLDHLGLTERYHILNDLQDEFDSRVGEFQGWLEENEDDIHLSTADDTNYQNLNRYTLQVERDE